MFRSEDDLWQQLTKSWPVTPGKVIVGAGDDCAVLSEHSDGTIAEIEKHRNAHAPLVPGHYVLFKTDIVVEDVHFSASAPPHLVGRKALARAISDIAAMGGRPGAALVTLGLPPDIKASRLRALYQGLNATARQYGVSLAGGETTKSPRLFLNIALLGETRGHAPVLRSTAQPGDLIMVTGRLGATQKRKHLTFEPRLAEGEFLAAQGFATSMMDISDGLGKDLPRLAHASRLGCNISQLAVPRARGASYRAAMSDGEDFELLFTLRPDSLEKLAERWHFPCSFTCIGRMSLKRTGRRPWKPPEDWIDGYDHLRQP